MADKALISSDWMLDSLRKASVLSGKVLLLPIDLPEMLGANRYARTIGLTYKRRCGKPRHSRTEA
jgi:hypothetical protein